MTELGTVIYHKLVQSLNASDPIYVTELGMVIDVKPLQFINARLPIEVTELGMVIDVKPLHSLNASSPIAVTELGITVFLHPNISVLVADFTIALQLFLESYTVFPLSTTMVVKPLQEPNAKSPIEVTELGMVIDVKPLQP